MARADLHIHSTASDGILTPTEIVERAASIGLAAVALADHDTVNGVAEALAAGEKYGVEVVPALEINTDYNRDEIHILGYFIDWQCERLQKRLAALREGRLERARKIVKKLRTLGVPVTIERVMEIAGSGAVGRPHVARAIIETGIVRSMNSAFGRYLIRGGPAYVERVKMAPNDAVSVIVDSGGTACLAHPSKSKQDEIIPSLIKNGMQAIEVYHTDHSPNFVRRYEAVARKFGLIATGGSDSHGGDIGGSEIGSVTVDAGVVEQLRAAASHY